MVWVLYVANSFCVFLVEKERKKERNFLSSISLNKKNLTMAKIHLKLDKRKNCQKRDGSYPVILALHHQSKSRPIGLRYSFTPDQWNEEENCPVNVPEAKHIKAKLEFYLMKAQVFLNERIIEIELWSIQELKTRLQAEIFSTVSTSDRTKMRFKVKKTNHISLTDYAKERIDLLRESRKNGNADAIEGAMNRLHAYLGTESISSAIWNARNYFLFMFNNMGINFIDLAKLKKKRSN